MTGHPGAEHRGAWQFPWDQVAGWNARLDMGVTSLPAKAFRIELVGATTPLIIDAHTSKKLPGLSFFAVSVPVWQKTLHLFGMAGTEASGHFGCYLHLVNAHASRSRTSRP